MTYPRILLPFLLLGASVLAHAAWDPNDQSRATGQFGDVEVEEAINDFLNNDPGMQRFFDNAHAFAIFPNVGKGGIGIGGAAGRGKVYAEGRYIGDVRLRQVTLGFQFGGQKFREIIFFRDKNALDQFTSGGFRFGAQASAVAATAGASADASYSDDVAIFTIAIKGLMYEATVSGQSFVFEPAN
jgi:lipid-binding SYLF domain-containing protein